MANNKNTFRQSDYEPEDGEKILIWRRCAFKDILQKSMNGQERKCDIITHLKDYFIGR